MRASLLMLSLPLVVAGACGAPTPTVRPDPAPPTAAPTADTPPAASRFPATRRGEDRDVLHGVTVPDPYRWLEDASRPEVQSWMKEQDRRARALLAGLPARERLAARFRELYYIDSVTPPYHEGKRWFFTRRHADREKAIVYYRDAKDGAEKVLFDPNTMAPDGSITLRGWSPAQDGRHVAYKLSKNNADMATLYIRDVDTGKDLPDVIEGARYAHASWMPDSKGFYYTWIPMDPGISAADRPGKQEVRFHKVGTDPATDTIVLPALDDPTKFVGAGVSRDGRWLILTVSHGWTRNDVWFKDLRRKGEPAAPPADASPFVKAGFSPLVVGQDAHYGVEAWKDMFYIQTDEGAPRQRLLRVAATRPAREGWKEIVPQRADATLESAGVVGGHLVITWMRNAQNELEVRRLDGTPVRQVPLPGLGSTGGMGGRPDEDEAYFSFTSFTQPSQIYRTSVKRGATDLWFEVKLPIDLQGMTSEQVWVQSRDGTKVSMFLVHRKDLERNGANPTLLYGYGGFNVSLSPYFSASLAVFLEHGGVVAIPNLRGGGEYGEDWHRAGMRARKQNVFDDFIAAAEWLIANQVTRPDRLAIMGGSNGGLLVGAAMVQRPELFRAVVCQVPLLDMVRYHLFGSGKTWVEEYGSADDPELFKAILAYSPYQHVKEGTRYPALLMASADSDDRVDPMHARKFTAAIQWATHSEAPVILRIETMAGHGGADLVKQRVEESADTYAFLFDLLGMR